MRTTTIKLNDARELASNEWLAPVAGRSIPVSVRNIILADAQDAAQVLDRPQRGTKDLYGFKPIPAGGRAVTNDLVNELREELGF